MIYLKDSFMNPSIDAIFGNSIYEYDIESAGFNISKQFHLLPKSDLDYLEVLSKKKRQIQIGLYQRKNRLYKENLKEGFINARKFFFEQNGLEEPDIITVKKDAIFTLKECQITQLGCINFRVKNKYTSYIRFKRPLELFYNSIKDNIDLKGFGDMESVIIEAHNDYLLSFIKKVIDMLEDEDVRVVKVIMKFINDYKSYKLPVDYYRTFDIRNTFIEKDDINLILEYDMNEYDDKDKENLDISYNYFNIIIPLLNIALNEGLLV